MNKIYQTSSYIVRPSTIQYHNQKIVWATSSDINVQKYHKMKRRHDLSYQVNQSVSLLLWFHTPCTVAHYVCPMSILTFDSGQCFKGSALCPLPFDLSEVYFYNCPCRYQMHIWEGAGAGGQSLSTNLLASCSSILLEAPTTDFLPLPTIPYCISLHVGVIDGALEIFLLVSHDLWLGQCKH